MLANMFSPNMCASKLLTVILDRAVTTKVLT